MSSRKGRRDLWDGDEFVDINSRSDGEPPQGDWQALQADNRNESGVRKPRSAPPDSRKSSREQRKTGAGKGRSSAASSRGDRKSGNRKEPRRSRSGQGGQSRAVKRETSVPRGRPEPQPRKRRRTMSLTKRRFLIVLALLVMVGGTLFLAESLLLRVAEVRVTGDSVYPEEEILQICDYKKGDNLLFIPISSREEKLQEQLPYVAKAKISRRLPSTVVVEITAARAACCLQAGGTWYVVDGQGKVLEARADPPDGLLQATGFVLNAAQIGQPLGVEDPAAAEALAQILRTVDSLGVAGDFTRLDVTDLYNIQIWYQDRVECRLGSAVELENKLQYAVGLLTGETGKGVRPEENGVLELSHLPDMKTAYFTPGKDSPVVQTPAPSSRATPSPTPESSSEEESGEEDIGEEDEQYTSVAGEPEGEYTEDNGEDEGYSDPEEEEESTEEGGGDEDWEDTGYEEGGVEPVSEE